MSDIAIPKNLPENLQPIAEEAHRLHEAALLSSQNNFGVTKFWRSVNTVLGLPAAILAAVSGGTTLAGHLGIWSGVMALSAAGLSGIMTSLNPSRRWQHALSSANSYLQLQTAIRQFLTIDLASGMSYEDARKQLADLTEQRNTLLKSSDAIPGWIYQKTRKQVFRGSQTYAVDKEK